jgi:nitrogen fixation protein NifU and related proteins
MNIYQQNILDHYKHPRNFGKLNHADKSSTKANPSCGDQMEIDVKLDEDVIKDIKFRGVGCAISVAATSMLTEKVKNMKAQDIKKINFNEVQKMLGIPISTGRIKCAMLGLETLINVLGK